MRGEMEDDVRVGARDDVGQFGRLNIDLHQGETARAHYRCR